MPRRQLTSQEINELLTANSAGVLATVGADGFPYAIPVNFLYRDDKIYIHGAKKGVKIDNIRQRPQVSFATFRELGFKEMSEPCKTATFYQSVIVKGLAAVLVDPLETGPILEAITLKYAPTVADKPLNPQSLAATAIIAVDILAKTGKCYER
ncbi:MAG: pyridoxamine 5'-phosphate oxidase family protein [Deltaproteobacteria bacterium]|jgi:nitroimidazol reductase NimA-like FMN-containing flavoprotein (pyridoxamine 5'-phosphate oxidase superfamily)|nr:pyridoxamine 5'-phosphate oxidase family protein [Deltaproteobacteria bacterium]